MPCGLVLFSIATHTVFSRLLHYYTLLRGLEPKNWWIYYLFYALLISGILRVIHHNFWHEITWRRAAKGLSVKQGKRWFQLITIVKLLHLSILWTRACVQLFIFSVCYTSFSLSWFIVKQLWVLANNPGTVILAIILLFVFNLSKDFFWSRKISRKFNVHTHNVSLCCTRVKIKGQL